MWSSLRMFVILDDFLGVLWVKYDYSKTCTMWHARGPHYKLLSHRLRRPGIKQVVVLCLEGGRKEEKSLEGEDGGGHGSETSRSGIFVPWLSHTLIGYFFLPSSQVVPYNYVCACFTFTVNFLFIHYLSLTYCMFMHWWIYRYPLLILSLSYALYKLVSLLVSYFFFCGYRFLTVFLVLPPLCTVEYLRAPYTLKLNCAV